MNSPESIRGNTIRYAVFLAFYFIVVGFQLLILNGQTVHLWETILFAIVGLLALLFYIRRFNREQRYFEKEKSSSFLDNWWFIVVLTLVVILTRILIAYLQTKKIIPQTSMQKSYLKKGSNQLFIFLLLSVGILLPILQQFLTTGFFFNYCFRKNNLIVAILGIISSGILFSLLNFQSVLVILIINALYGMLFAYSYLYSQSIWLPIYLAVINGIFTVLII